MAPTDNRGGKRGSTEEFAAEELAMLRDFFRDEAHDVFERMTTALLSAEKAPPTPEALAEMMRFTHTIKGTAGTVGLHDMVGYTHQLEDELARLRAGSRLWSRAVGDQLLAVVDALRSYVDNLGSTTQDEHAERVEDQLYVLYGPQRQAQGQAKSQAQGQSQDRQAAQTVTTVSMATNAGVERALPQARPGDSKKAAGTALPGSPARRPPTVDPAGNDISTPGEAELSDGTVAPYEVEDTTRSIVAGTLSGPLSDGRGVLRVDPARIDALMDSVAELTVDRTRIERRIRGLTRMADAIYRLGESLAENIAKLASEDAGPDRGALATALTTLNDQLTEHAAQLGYATKELRRDTDALKRTTASLQTGLTQVRMLSVKSLFQAMSHQVRALARSSGKQIRVLVSGEETEFDKTVAERITDPLIQLLRNAVAHGIESAPVRARAGKPAEGEIELSAHQEGSLVVIEVADDGAGIDPAVLRGRLVAAGHWSRAKAELASDEDVLHAIFEPGVSTREKADELAGRGVGLDTVRATVARLGGEIHMKSTPGRGTRFIMRLPVTTAVTHALLFRIGREVYAIPEMYIMTTAKVVRVDRAAPGQVTLRHARGPLIVLHRVLGGDLPASTEVVPVIELEYAGKEVAITCDEIVGSREIVVKDLGPLLSPLSLYSGATISGTGRVQLIIDPAELVRMGHPKVAPAVADAAPPTRRTRPTRALVADDSLAVREAISRILSSAGYEVDIAEDGAVAWELVQAKRYGLLITDIEMPGLNGLSLIERVRRDERMADVPIIIVSSQRDPQHHERARELGVEEFVAKPVTWTKLMSAIQAVDGT